MKRYINEVSGLNECKKGGNDMQKEREREREGGGKKGRETERREREREREKMMSTLFFEFVLIFL